MLGRCWVIDVDMMDDSEGLQAVSRSCYIWGQARSSSRSPARAGDDGLDVEEAGLQRRVVVGETIRLSSGGDGGDLELAIRRESARVVRVAGSTQGRYLQAKGPLGGKVAAEQARDHRMLTARWKEREERTFARG